MIWKIGNKFVVHSAEKSSSRILREEISAGFTAGRGKSRVTTTRVVVYRDRYGAEPRNSIATNSGCGYYSAVKFYFASIYWHARRAARSPASLRPRLFDNDKLLLREKMAIASRSLFYLSNAASPNSPDEFSATVLGVASAWTRVERETWGRIERASAKVARGVGFGPEPRPAIGRRVRALISRYFSGFIFSPVALSLPRFDPPRYLQGNVRQSYHSSFELFRSPPCSTGFKPVPSDPGTANVFEQKAAIINGRTGCL